MTATGAPHVTQPLIETAIQGNLCAGVDGILVTMVPTPVGPATAVSADLTGR
jgi:hypothetical protein